MARKAAKPIEEKPREIDGIPTAHGLTIMGAQYAAYTRTGHIRITDEGHRLLAREQRAAAREDQEAGIWHGVSGKHPAPPDQPGWTESERHVGGQHGRART